MLCLLNIRVVQNNVFFSIALGPLGKVDPYGKYFTDFFSWFLGTSFLVAQPLFDFGLKSGRGSYLANWKWAGRRTNYPFLEIYTSKYIILITRSSFLGIKKC